DEKTGLLFAFISMTIPIYNKMILQYLIDYAFVAMVALGYMFYLYSDNFNHKTYSMLFGLVFGLGMLTKWSYPVYFGILILFSLGKLDKTKIINLSLASLIVLIIIFSWYFPRLATLPQQLSVYAGNQEGYPLFNTLPSLTYYLKEIINGFSLVYFLLFILCLFYAHKTKNEIYNIFFIYAIFTLLTIKVSRYIMPICIFMTAILVEGLSNLSVKFKQTKFNRYKIDNLIVGFILLAGFFSLSFPEKINSSIDVNKILSSIEDQNYTVCIIAESDELNDVNTPYYAMKNNYPVKYMIGNGCNPLAFDYAIVGPIETSWRSNNFKYSEITLINNLDKFETINIIHNITIYKKKLN
ncbi:MAG: hypothetical protein AABW92_05265, partial [Nanoarchaeota archaeon]